MHPNRSAQSWALRLNKMVAFSKLVAYSLSVTFPLSVLAYLWWRKRNQVENYEKVGHVTGLYIYPVKSCKGISLDSGVCLIEGIQFDRRWVVMDKDEKPIKVADKPSLAVVTPHFEDEKYLCLNAPGMDTLKLDLEPPEDSKDIKDLKVSRMSSKSRYAGDEAAAWFSTYLDLPGCKVYQICEPRYCAEDTKWGNRARPMDKTGYASLSAYHIVTESSLDVLNENLSAPVGMDRFRANIVIGGTPPYAEDQWITKTVKVGDVRLRLLKQCGRCAVTTVDPDTGEKDKLEPLATLRRMRLFEDRDPRHGQAPFFGLQMAAENQGFVKLGDPVFVSC